jgi:hypothetical protein
MVLFRSVQMRLYALHKRQFVAVFAVFFICLFVTILIGIAGPSVIQSNIYKPENPQKQLVNEIIFEIFISNFLLFFCLVWSI